MKLFGYLWRLWWLAKAPLTGDGEGKHSLRFLFRVLPALIRAKGPRILFERHSGMGDIICTFPAVLALKKQYPDSVIVFAVKAEFAPVVEMAQVADVVAPMRYGVWTNPGWMDQFFDKIYRPLNEDESQTGANQSHLVDSFCAKCDVTPAGRQPRITVPSKFEGEMRSRFRRAGLSGETVVAVNTGPSWAIREWTTAGWEELARWLVEVRKVKVLLLGADVHFGLGSTSAVRLPGALDWIGQISLEETIACIGICDLFIGIDSGLLHVAGAVNTPSVSLFGPTYAHLRLPQETPAVAASGEVDCLGCHHRHPIIHWRSNCPHDIACMKTLSVEKIKTICDQMLQIAAARKGVASERPGGE